MRAGMLAFTGGTSILYSIASLPPWWLLWILASVFWVAWFMAGPAPPLWRALAVATSLLALVSGSLEQRIEGFNTVLPQGQQTLQGYPCSVPRWRDGQGLVLDFCLTSGLDRVRFQPRLRVTLPESEPGLLPSGPHRLQGVLRPLRVPANPGRILGEAHYLRHGLIARTRVDAWKPSLHSPCPLHCRYHSWRLGLIERLRGHLPGIEEPGLVEALTLGSRAALTPGHWQVLQDTGTQHLVAISGLHLGIIALIFAALARWCLIRLAGEGGAARVWLLTGLVVAGSAFYALLAGFSLPTQRALVMLVVASMAMSSGRQLQSMDAWLLALVLVLLADPLAPLSMGFWLSFTAVACLILSFANRLRQPPAWKTLVMAQSAVVLGLWPLLLAFDRNGSALALAVNLLAIPLMSLLLMPLLLISLPFVLASGESANWVAPGLALMLDNLWQGLQWLAGFSAPMPSLPLSVTFLAALAVLLTSFPVSRLWRLITLILLVSWLVLWPWQKYQAGPVDAEMVFLDVPGVTAVLIRDGPRVALYYQDNRPYPASLPVPHGLQETLRALSVQALDLLIVPYGLKSIPQVWERAGWPVRQVIAGGDVGAGNSCPGGETWHHWPSLTLQFWQDSRQDLSSAERSCVVRVSLQGERAGGTEDIVLAGGIGRSGERRVLKWLQDPGRVSGLLAPASGRAGSSQPGWVSQIQPEWVVFDQPPAPEILARYRRQTRDWWYPRWHGAVTVRPGEESHRGMREHAPFWWRRPPE